MEIFVAALGLKVAGEIREPVNIDVHLPRKWLWFIIYVPSDLAKNNPEVTRRVAKSLLSGMRCAQDNPRWAIEKSKIDGEALQNALNFLIEYGIVSKDKAPRLE